MCGIAGSINHKLNIPLLTKSLWHRGPDEQNTYEIENLQLHHHRLSILDIAGGRQPMHFEHLTIIFNGEIYNHLDVRKQRNLVCKTNSDTETILCNYAANGSRCLDDFDGMFAFAIYDNREEALFIARDRAGKKPLYYFSDGVQFLFASELNSLRQQLTLEIDDENIQQYIRMGYFYKWRTPYKNVYELPAGSFLKVSLKDPRPEIQKWWDIYSLYSKATTDDFETALYKTDQYLHKAVKNRVESSDLEVGSFLSGGIDSGLVTAIASEYNSSLKTFTVSFEGEYDEAPLARLVAEKYKTRHHEIRISFKNLLNDIEKILYNYGEPFFDSSAIPSYYVSQAAKQHLTVVLNGDGGDEMFGGYRRYIPFTKYDFLKSGFLVKGFARTLSSMLPLPDNKKSIYSYVYRLADFAGKDGIDSYLSATIDSFEGLEKYLKAGSRLPADIQNDFNRINQSSLSGLHKIMNLDFDNILAGDLLVKMDIATMASSLEGRSPLLGKDILEYAPTLPDEYKIKGKTTKFILRKLAEKYLPGDLVNQPKRGFEIPLKKWVNNELKDMIVAYLFSANACNNNFVLPGFIKNIWDRKIKINEEKRAKIIWTFFALEVWYKKNFLEENAGIK